MSLAYLNGNWLPLEQAQVSVLDRGFLFGDGVYEVIPVYKGQALRLEQHLQRLHDSLAGIRLANPHSDSTWRTLIAELIQRSGGGDQLLYLQITRGAAPRDHAFPAANTSATVLLSSKPFSPPDAQRLAQGIRVGLAEDPRWQLCNLKTVNLLANVLLKQLAVDQGHDEMLLHAQGLLTEGTSSNVFVIHDQVIATPPLSSNILPGVTRGLILELAHNAGMAVEERAIALDELKSADEVWISSSTRELMPVVEIDGVKVADGMPGPLARQLSQAFRAYALAPVAAAA
ncbi:MAG: D-amino acid aminotransferase [Gammaproteobacteria bacterium]